MTLKVVIDCDNAAFHDDCGNIQPGPEVARILRKLADLIEEDFGEARDRVDLRDYNGNNVGYAKAK